MSNRSFLTSNKTIYFLIRQGASSLFVPAIPFLSRQFFSPISFSLSLDPSSAPARALFSVLIDFKIKILVAQLFLGEQRDHGVQFFFDLIRRIQIPYL